MRPHPIAVGTAAEICVVNDLLRRGYDVFMQVTPSSDLDLVVDTEVGLKGVEVKYNNKSLRGKNRFDILAVVMETGKIEYTPELDSKIQVKGGPGRPKKKIPVEQRFKLIKLRSEGASYREISESMGVSKSTVFRWLSMIKRPQERGKKALGLC